MVKGERFKQIFVHYSANRLQQYQKKQIFEVAESSQVEKKKWELPERSKENWAPEKQGAHISRQVLIVWHHGSVRCCRAGLPSLQGQHRESVKRL